MTRLIAGMTMSLDGFVADAEGKVQGLSPDFEELMASAAMKDAIRDTGAVIMGRRIFDMAPDPDSYADDYEFRVPLVIVTSKPPARHPKESNGVSITFATNGVADAVKQAKAAAGKRDVTCVGGPTLIRALLEQNLVDELQVDIAPIMFGGGLRMFDQAGAHKLRLKNTSRLTSGRVCLSYTLT